VGVGLRVEVEWDGEPAARSPEPWEGDTRSLISPFPLSQSYFRAIQIWDFGGCVAMSFHFTTHNTVHSG
jgi:hypothetical protein